MQGSQRVRAPVRAEVERQAQRLLAVPGPGQLLLVHDVLQLAQSVHQAI
jgi:hypothetical protein